MIRRMTQILEIVKFMTQPLCHKYFPWLAFACPKFTIETLEQGVKFVINKDIRTMPLT